MPWAANSAANQAYLEVTWYPPFEAIDEAISWAYGFSAAGFEYDDGTVAAPPYTDIPLKPGEPFVRVYLPRPVDSEWLNSVRQYCGRKGWRLESRPVFSEDWANAWKRYYEPQFFHQGYAVVRAWQGDSPRDAAHTLRLDPGMAFGTGTHATTRMCLNALIDMDLSSKRVLDLGAGSGILGMMASRRGASEVVFVEPDEVAVRALLENLSRDSLLGKTDVVSGTLEDVRTTSFDVLCLNLIWDIIRSVWNPIQSYLAPHARLLLSGLLKERRGDMEEMVRSTGQQVLHVEESQGWLLVVVQNDTPEHQ